ncbi:alpha/beta fold hydrolase [Antribacter gilvus]|uniref:alpha/beta fold hydrolase n=1 Tax=Antribacter gilvus TaxID=2304675 RepID=UPI000F771BFA|nr:alpha/beta hydrolase [Antribacter gilvus]
MTRTTTHSYTDLDVTVAGGALRVGVWEPEPSSASDAPTPTVLAVHGITASHQAWPAVAAALPGVRVVAPDLRGRGRSNHLPGPFGMGAHADDLAAVLKAVAAGPVVVLGHSMGGFASVVLAHRYPHLVSRLVLVDGGLPLPPPAGLPEGATHEEVLQALLGPAVERLGRTFASREAYRDFWRAHPAFAGAWDEVVEGYVDYDLVETGAGLRPATSPEAVAHDSLDLYEGGPLMEALLGPDPVRVPITLLRAPRGLLDEPGGLYPAATVEDWTGRLPGLVVREVAGVNHYTIIMSPAGVAAVAEEISTVEEDR